MNIEADEGPALAALESRIKILLPEEYQDCYEDVQPTSMGSAGLRFDEHGKVAWNEMWGSFCDLAMAGGPPHKGTLLEPAVAGQIDAEPGRYRSVVDEICRGVAMVTDLEVKVSQKPGWVRVNCHGEAMAGWLLRAIVMENVAVQANGAALFVPAAPHYRLEKEIKNVVTVMAKTCHYWMGHMWAGQRQAIGQFFHWMAQEAPLIQPAASDTAPLGDVESLVVRMTKAIKDRTGLGTSSQKYTGWLGVESPSTRAAIWMMRALVASNVLSRREGTILFVPVNPHEDPGGDRVVNALVRTHRFATLKRVQ